MLPSLGILFLVGLSLAGIFKRLKLPRLVGMLLTGILLGPYVLNVLDASILGISAELRRLALVIILTRAGLSLNFRDLLAVGRPALLLSFLPATFEILAYTGLALGIFGISYMEAALMGAVLSAVSPAVVVPKMTEMIDKKIGTGKCIPQMILAGASLDDAFVIVCFSSILNMAQGLQPNAMAIAKVPLSIIVGVFLGFLSGLLLFSFFEYAHTAGYAVKNSMKLLVILSISLLLISAEELLKDIVPISGLPAVMAMGMTIAWKCPPRVTSRLKEKYGKIWLAAEVLLFVLVGAAVDIRYTLQAGPKAVLMIILALFIRSLGVWLCTVKTTLTKKERVFCILAYLPKATVQAAIGSVPLAAGLPCGNLILSTAVLAILITAPLGAILIDYGCKRLLDIPA